MDQLEKKIKSDFQAPNLMDGDRKLAPLKEQAVEKEELRSQYKLLINYKHNQQKLDTLILLEQDEETLQELKQMKEDITEAIQAEEEKIKSIQNNEYFYYSTEILKEEYIERLAKCFLEKDNKWYHAQILSMNVDEQVAEVQFIGYKDIIKLHAIFIKLMASPDPELFQPGFSCEAIYSDDGSYYPCLIEKITEDGKYVVKFKKYGNKETVSIYYLRDSKKIFNNQIKKKTFDDLTSFKLPDHLKILPNDNEMDREKKKKKIKALKQSFKQAQIEKDQSEKQNKWINFVQKGQQTNIGHFSQQRNKGSIFQSPDTIEGKVGVTRSGQGMTNFAIRTKQLLEDSSHLSKMF